MTYSASTSTKAAIGLVTTALQSGSIKLIGSHSNDIKSSENFAKADAAYLAMLLAELSGAIQKMGE